MEDPHGLRQLIAAANTPSFHLRRLLLPCFVVPTCSAASFCVVVLPTRFRIATRSARTLLLADNGVDYR
ncbi:MAG: hypothetical protein QOH31_1685 [Verrucomicrobiota bacterium]|jgi:hypothetical protein